MDSIENRVIGYWTKRTDDFFFFCENELNDGISGLWVKEFLNHIPNDKNLKILDVGTGVGYFAILLGKKGYSVTGIDLTPSMINKAKFLAKKENVNVKYSVMDAQKLSFPNESFDAVVSRNLTWTLPNAEAAYKEWFRVLKKGGVLLNFDANYGRSVDKNAADTDKNRPYGHNGITKELEEENSYITKAMKINYKDRPNWDLNVLNKIGFKQCLADTGVGKRILMERDIKESPLFKITARKGVC